MFIILIVVTVLQINTWVKLTKLYTLNVQYIICELYLKVAVCFLILLA